LIVVGALLAVGGVVVGLGYRSQPPPNQPIGQARSSGPGPVEPGQQLPGNHPPIEIPENVLKVIARMEKIAGDEPDNLEAWKQLAFVQYRAGQIQPDYLDKAESSYQHVLEKSPQDLDALRGLGNVAYDRNDPEKALELYRRYLEIEPGDKAVRTDMATMLLSAKKPEAAIEIYRGVLQEDPTFFQAQFNLAIAYRSAGQSDLAIAALQRAKEIAPDDEMRGRVEMILAQADGGPARAAAASDGGIREAIEAVFRSHPIVGPRIDAFRWESDQRASVVLRDFPMAGMPPMVREKFVSRLTSGVRDSKKRFDVSEPISIDVVDAATGDTMVNITG
jgi:cytochrome c-type biogenesis protein CcmH/NrfG